MRKYLNVVPTIIGAIITAFLGSIISTQRIIGASSDISSVYAERLDFGTRLSNTGYDLLNFAPLYFIFVFIAFLIAMTAADWLAHKKPSLSLPIFLGAGFVAVIVMLLGMKMAFFNVDLLAGARDNLGYVLQGICGSIGAWYIYRSRNKNDSHQHIS